MKKPQSLSNFTQKNFQPTQDQFNAIKTLETFINSDDDVFILTGYAGTGKTEVIKMLASYFEEEKMEFLLLSPTGKAARLLSEKTGSKAGTIHGRIYNHDLFLEVDQVSLTNCFNLSLNKKPPRNSIIIVDEASMIPDMESLNHLVNLGTGKLLTDMLDFFKGDWGMLENKIIFVGDSAQLPPVKEQASCALSPAYFLEKHNLEASVSKLETIVRQDSKSYILKNAMAIRKQIDIRIEGKIVIHGLGKEIRSINHGEMSKTFLKGNSDLSKGNSIIIARKNIDVNAINREVRNALKFEPDTIQKDEMLILSKNAPLIHPSLMNGAMVHVRKVYKSSIPKEVYIKTKRERRQKVTLSFRTVIISLISGEGVKSITCMILENHLYANNTNLKNLQLALYTDFVNRNQRLEPNSKEFNKAIKKDLFFNALWVKYGYAITAHKSQGSEWKRVILQVDEKDLEKPGKGFLRWLYTAVTRAEKDLFIHIKKIEDKTSSVKTINPATKKNRQTRIRTIIKKMLEEDRHYLPINIGQKLIQFRVHEDRPPKKLLFLKVSKFLKDKDIDVCEYDSVATYVEYKIESDYPDLALKFKFNRFNGSFENPEYKPYNHPLVPLFEKFIETELNLERNLVLV